MEREETKLKKELMEAIRQKNWGFKWFIFGIILLFTNFFLMALYNFIWWIVKFNNTNAMETAWLGGGEKPLRYPWAQSFARVLEFISKRTPFELIIFSLIWLTSLIIIMGAYWWLSGLNKTKTKAELKGLGKIEK
jgi:hypothetical protein